MIKKFVAICGLIALPLVVSCNSSDDVIRNNATYEGTWQTDSLFYTFGTFEAKHKFSEMPAEGVAEGEQIVEELLTLNEKTSSLIEIDFNGKAYAPVTGNIQNETITFNSANEKFTPRKIVSYSDTKLRLQYDFTMRGRTLPVTVTYNKVK